MILRLTRRAYLPMGTFGQLRISWAGYDCWTVERPWQNNEPYVSCIPIGRYDLKLGTFYRGTQDTADDYAAYQVLDVPGRTYIKIHIANVMDDVQGCIGVGKGLGWIKSRRATGAKLGVNLSAVTYEEFMNTMGGMEHATLIVENFTGGRS
jgi:hypothetical protein